ncbi:MAG: hypothetical protein KKB82_07080 [Candidatus Omnitrophica bacterium]|nr:hypothetical protein [Candidatus Omnitrophota bacterium]
MSVLNAKLNFSFLCDYVSISREGKLNMNGIFENINVRSLPAIHPMMYVVANVSGLNNGDRFTCDLIMASEPQKKLVTMVKEVVIDPKRNFGFVGQFVNVKYETSGKYHIKFYVDNKEIGTHEFEVCVVS